MHNIDNTQAIIRKFEPIVKSLNEHELRVVNNLIIERLNLMLKVNSLVSMAKIFFIR